MSRCVVMALIALMTGAPTQDENPKGADQPKVAEQPESSPVDTATSVKPTQSQIYEELLRDTQRIQEPIMSTDPDRPDGAARPGEDAGDGGLLLEGTVLVERSGRLVRRGDSSEFKIAPGSLPENAPEVMEFNKNGLLEAMEREHDTGVMQFVISAEVTRYRGRNYLTLLKYRRTASHGNLSP